MICHTPSSFRICFKKTRNVHGFGQTVHSASEMGSLDTNRENGVYGTTGHGTKKKQHEHELKKKMKEMA